MSSRMEVPGGRTYLHEVLSIVPRNAMWVAIKTGMLIQEIKIDDHIGYQLVDGTVLTLQDMSWNDMMSLGQEVQDYTSFNSVLTPEDTPPPNYHTPTSGIRFGYFEDVYKMGYIIFPLEAHKGFNNKPIILKKRRLR